ncbi:MAG TPA: HypC/HybG/HupF family hydrogenase formation chaperone [Pirellulales bacterium]|nr:HypC/HybG/HupF family hydrogenase formation chaperone [Pirellulales bacterium]
MCLGVPGRVVRWIDRDPTFASAEVEFDGVRRVCHMACVPEAEVGDYAIVHAGVAISRIDVGEAERLLAELAILGDDEGWRREGPA